MSMLLALKRNGFFIGYAFVRNMASAMEFRTSFIIQVVSSFFFLIGLYGTWCFLIDTFGSINGWTIADSARVFALSLGAIDMTMLFFYSIKDISKYITNGQLGLFLGYPMHPIVLMGTLRARPSSLGSVPAMFVLLYYAESMSLVVTLKYLILLPIAMLIFINYLIIVQSAAFFVGPVDQLANRVIMTMINITDLPYVVLSARARMFAATIIPVFFIAILPAQLLKSFEWHRFLLLLVYAAGSSFLALSVFNAGLKRYDAGNLMGSV